MALVQAGLHLVLRNCIRFSDFTTLYPTKGVQKYPYFIYLYIIVVNVLRVIYCRHFYRTKTKLTNTQNVSTNNSVH